jgi:hypothetical protein
MMSSLVDGCDITGDVAAFVREQDQEAKGTKSGGRVAPGTPNAFVQRDRSVSPQIQSRACIQRTDPFGFAPGQQGEVTSTSALH